MNERLRIPVWSTLVLGLALAAYDQSEPQAEAERVRAIKPYFVAEPAGGDVRRFSGTVNAANTSALSFTLSGTVQTVEVATGERVSAGQLLATLDREPFELDVAAARSELASAQAEFDKTKLDLARQRQLFERGWVAQAALDQANAAADGAQAGLSLARSRLGLAERDLGATRLEAPFDGVIAERDVEPFVEVSKGEPVFQIDSEGVLEVDISVPDTLVRRITLGAPVTIDAATFPGCGCSGRVTEIGVAAGAANAVTVTAAELDAPAGLLPGAAVDASVTSS